MKAFNITDAWVSYPNKPEKDCQIQFPAGWELLDYWELKFYCPNCFAQNTITGNQLTPPNDGGNMKFLKTPTPEFFPLSVIKLYNEIFTRTIIDEKWQMLKIEGSNTWPNFALSKCYGCTFNYLFTWLLGVGMEERPPKPNVLYIDEMIGLDCSEVQKLLNIDENA